MARNFLVVDDDFGVRSTYTKILELSGCNVTNCGTYDSALKVIRDLNIPLDAALIDHHLDEPPRVRDGFELIPIIKSERPNVLVYALSGSIDKLNFSHDCALIQKPVDMLVLMEIANGTYVHKK